VKLLRIFKDVDLRGGHEGLLEVARKEDKDARPRAGDVIAFFNTRRDKVKVLAFTDEEDGYPVLGYYISPSGRVPPECVEFIAESFGGGGLKMNEAIRKGLEKHLAKRRRGAEPTVN